MALIIDNWSNFHPTFDESDSCTWEYLNPWNPSWVGWYFYSQYRYNNISGPICFQLNYWFFQKYLVFLFFAVSLFILIWLPNLLYQHHETFLTCEESFEIVSLLQGWWKYCLSLKLSSISFFLSCLRIWQCSPPGSFPETCLPGTVHCAVRVRMGCFAAEQNPWIQIIFFYHRTKP